MTRRPPSKPRFTPRPRALGIYAPTDVTLDHIVALAEQARPDWDSMLLRIVLRDVAPHVHGNDLAIVTLRLASDPTSSPKALKYRGPHWQDVDSRPPEAEPVGWCAVCGRREQECWQLQSLTGTIDHEFERTTRRGAQ